MIYEILRSTDLYADEVLDTLGVTDLADLVWPLPNAEAISAPAYWNRYMQGGAQALIEIGIRRVAGRSCRVFATYETGDRTYKGGLAVAVNVHSLEPLFFSWSACTHQYEAAHERRSSRYACAKCGHAYVVEFDQ